MSEVDLYSSDEEFNPQAHKNLLENVNRLGKIQHIKPPTRTEPTLIQDEFHLVKNSEDPSVTATDLLKALKPSNRYSSVSKELRKANLSKKVLEKPLEKPIADRIQRTIGYEKMRKKLSRWDAVVARNRSDDHQIFPLNHETVYINTAALRKPPQRSVKSNLMIELEAIEEKLNELKKNNQNSKNNDNEEESEREIQEKLTRKELIARRKEIAYLKMKESRKSAKARMQNKIKSKKYHKLMKRQKLKEEMKEFEMLQKTNPEAALKKLEILEKSRVQERGTLRHKNTGTWAKNLQVRAKYDKDARKDLAEQLALSRELTQKKNDEDDESNEEDDSNENEIDENDCDYDPFNPWIKVKGKTSQKNEVAEFYSGYRKYWMERNENEEKMKNLKNSYDSDENKEIMEEAIDKCNDLKDDIDFNNVDINNTINQEIVVDKQSSSENRKPIKKSLKRKKIKSQTKKKTDKNEWLVEEINSEVISSDELESIKKKNIDNIFDEAEEVLQEKVSKKLNKLSKSLKQENTMNVNEKNVQSKDKDELQQLKDLSFKGSKNRPEFDEELIESVVKEKNMTTKQHTNNMAQTNSHKEKTAEEQIDPEKYAHIKPKLLRTSLPSMVNENDEWDEDSATNEHSKSLVIAEAFEDDDIVADFLKDREDEQNKNTAEEIDLSLPGWGSWAGCGISTENKNKRLILKFPKEEKRRDENKQNVYINEEPNKKLKEHLVSDLPFPFTSVKDYESSIRAPIGRTFVPETAFRVLTKPSVITKKGQIINPMDEKILVQPPKRPRHIVEKRIMKLNKKS